MKKQDFRESCMQYRLECNLLFTHGDSCDICHLIRSDIKEALNHHIGDEIKPEVIDEFKSNTMKSLEQIGFERDWDIKVTFDKDNNSYIIKAKQIKP